MQRKVWRASWAARTQRYRWIRAIFALRWRSGILTRSAAVRAAITFPAKPRIVLSGAWIIRIIHAPLKTMRGFAGNVIAARTAADRVRMPERHLNANMARIQRYRCVRAAHDARQTLRCMWVRNHARVGIQRNGLPVEQ